jgi:hypothetical protein
MGRTNSLRGRSGLVSHFGHRPQYFGWVVLVELSSPAALVAAAIFVFAAVAKLRSPASTRSAVGGFGLPTLIAPILAPVEFVTALLLMVVPKIGGAVAAILLTAFTVVVIRALRKGLAVRCGCFGGTDQRPVGPDTVARNLFLLLLAVASFLGAPSLQGPTLPAILTVGAGGAAALLVIALVRVRSELGTLFGQSLSTPGSHS